MLDKVVALTVAELAGLPSGLLVDDRRFAAVVAGMLFVQRVLGL